MKSPKVDLVMWTKNGEASLQKVLERINHVIPEAKVNQRIIVDDSSSDGTVKIAKSLGWMVIPNEGSGISAGANTAFNHVQTAFFCSFEQDLLLSFDWWNKIVASFSDSKVAVASGFRLPSGPSYLVKLQEYSMNKYRRELTKPSFLYGKNLDNTMYRTSVIKELGGFPVLAVSPGVDNVLAKMLHEAGYMWQVNFDVLSVHLRKGFCHELRQYWWYGKCYRELKKHLGGCGDSILSIFLRTLFSPFRGVQVAWKKKSFPIVFAYPLIRLTILLGVFYSYLGRVKQ
jgi:glycosyltransferase involved in cell wall biosynthesis